MNAHLDEQVQEAIERVEYFDVPPESFPAALSTEVRLLIGIDWEFRDSNLEILLHGSLNY